MLILNSWVVDKTKKKFNFFDNASEHQPTFNCSLKTFQWLSMIKAKLNLLSSFFFFCFIHLLLARKKKKKGYIYIRVNSYRPYLICSTGTKKLIIVPSPRPLSIRYCGTVSPPNHHCFFTVSLFTLSTNTEAMTITTKTTITYTITTTTETTTTTTIRNQRQRWRQLMLVWLQKISISFLPEIAIFKGHSY